MASLPNRTPPRPNSTTAGNAADAAKAKEREAKKKEQAGATLVEQKKNPAVLRSRYNLRDPDSGVYLNQGELAEVPHVSPWLRSQINAGIVEVVSGDDDAPEFQDPGPLPGSHAASLQPPKPEGNGGGEGNEGDGDNELPRLDGESDEDYAKRKAASEAK